ncbi:MAG: TVP38/TMEM64 family protein [Kiritimatiellae bacterium]|nr:TVP38/TMEM64 family protein [Kiritimatiellia bacterium]
MPDKGHPDEVLTPIKALLRLSSFLLIAVAGVLIARYTPARQWLTVETMTELSQRLGWMGVVVLALYGVLSPLLFLPRWPLAFVAGLLYGIFLGSVLAVLASTIGAGFHYYLSRTLLSPVADRARRCYGVEHLVIPKQRQFLVIFLLRAFPLSSFVATNLLAGTLRMHSGRFLWASLLGMIPSTLMYASGGKLVKQPTHHYYWFAGLVIVLMVAGTVAAHRWLYPVLRKPSPVGGEDGEKHPSQDE